MLQVRTAAREDASLVLALIRELAQYEGEPAIRATEDDLIRDGFGDRPRFECVIAEMDGIPAGYALFFITTRPGRVELGSISKICTFAHNFVDLELAAHCYGSLPSGRFRKT
jgi:hypothetical protein